MSKKKLIAALYSTLQVYGENKILLNNALDIATKRLEELQENNKILNGKLSFLLKKKNTKGEHVFGSSIFEELDNTSKESQSK